MSEKAIKLAPTAFATEYRKLSLFTFSGLQQNVGEDDNSNASRTDYVIKRECHIDFRFGNAGLRI